MSTNSDQLHRFIFDDTDIRGEIVSLKHSLQEAFSTQHYPLPLQKIVSEFLAAVSLMSRTLKFAGTMTLQARGDGDVSLIVAEVSHQKKVRAVAQFQNNSQPEQWRDDDLRSLIGQGVLSIIIDPDKGERYQGIVPLDKGSLSECLEDYFNQSEQLPTRIWLAADEQHASGMMLQRLPQQLASTETNDDSWATLSALADTISTSELLSLEHSVLLTRLFHEIGVRLFDAEAIVFSCSCSKERSSKALKQLGKEELNQIIREDGSIKVDCHFCGHQYEYLGDDIEQLFSPETRH